MIDVPAFWMTPESHNAADASLEVEGRIHTRCAVMTPVPGDAVHDTVGDRSPAGDDTVGVDTVGGVSG